MRHSSSWSIPLFRWGDVHVRLHVFFLLFAAFTLSLGWTRSLEAPDGVWIAAASVGVLLASVLLHEIGHYVAAMHFGVAPPVMVIGPLGGLSTFHPPRDAREELLLYAMGPLVNLSICLGAGLLLVTYVGNDWWGLLHPLAPRNLFEPLNAGTFLLTLKLTFWINWVLLVVNLLPAFPFDGGCLLRAALLAANPEVSPRRAAALVALFAKIIAAVMLVVAIFWWSDKSNVVLPVWFSLVVLAFVLYFSAKQEEERADAMPTDDEVFGYDFSQGYTSLERTNQVATETVSPFRRWLAERRQARLDRQREIEADEERRVDEILSRLHSAGMQSLSVEDQMLLKRVSQRLRHRQGKG